ncbi:hypothetical protein G7Z17_g635 [Cylindrodendrum hubeiense]|uniref:Uncharacterized protein n=1 Tax=Cylindrodendrum hubeiense TaxID=595255 RepID=A0A9P5HKR7_9HYPO|nr:hypothetical protein G7Z17_g635 [Cylindrodendrum hubeiense]
MRKFFKKLKDGGSGREPTNNSNPRLSRGSSKYVVNPNNGPVHYPPNPPPPNPHPPYPPPPPGPSKPEHLDEGAPITAFSGFDSWMSSFAPDPHQSGAVEVAAAPVDEIGAYLAIQVTIYQVKKLHVGFKRFTVVISGPWYMTLAQVNKVLKENDFVPPVFARNAQSDPFWNGKHCSRSGYHVAVVDRPSCYDPDKGLLINRDEGFGAFVNNLRQLKLSCSGGMLKAESFPASIEIDFNRTLRLPEGIDNHHNPSGLGIIPVYNTAAIQKKLMASGNRSLVEMAKKGGVFFPLYQREAMFISFNAVNDIFALRLFVGGVNALSGMPWNSQRLSNKQDYILVPPQIRVDGVSVGDDVVRQFIAMPLGSGYSVEKQVTGRETTGGLQIEITPGNLWQIFNMGDEGSQLDTGSTARNANTDVLDLRFAAPELKSTGLSIDLPDNSEEPKYLHMRHLYLQQLGDDRNIYALFGQQPTHLRGFVPWHPGAHVQMIALYELELSITWQDAGYIGEAKVRWPPWWDLMDCWDERKKAGFKVQGQELSSCDVFLRSIDGKLLVNGYRYSLQQQGVQDGDTICVQPRKSGMYNQYASNPQAASPIPPRMQQTPTQQSSSPDYRQDLWTPSPQSSPYQQPVAAASPTYAMPPPSPPAPQYYGQSSPPPAAAPSYPGRSSYTTPSPYATETAQQSIPQSQGAAPTQAYESSSYSSTPIPEQRSSLPPAVYRPQSHTYSPPTSAAGQMSPGPSAVSHGRCKDVIQPSFNCKTAQFDSTNAL